MKKAMRLVAYTALVPILLTALRAEKRESVEVSKTAQAVNFTQAIDLSPWDKLSAQAVYSDGTPSTGAINSGSRASATITIGSNPTGLDGLQASLTINVKSTATISGKSVTLNGVLFTADTDFTAAGVSTITAAANLAAKIDANANLVATVSGATVTVKYVLYGTSGNGLPAVTSSAANFGLSAATFTGGVNQYSIYINGVQLQEGTAFTGTTSSATTGNAIITAINASTSLNTQVIASSTTPGVVVVKAIAPGYSNYSITSDTTGFTTNGGFPGGSASDVDLSADLINKTNHRLTTGLKVLLVTTAGTAPTGLTTGTTYFAIKLNDNQYALATTSTTAVAGTKIDITAVTDSATNDVRPLALATIGGNGLFWEVSNDNVNYSSLTGVTVNGVSVSSVTYSAAGSTAWDFGPLNYKYIRCNFTGPTSGGIALTVKVFGKKD